MTGCLPDESEARNRIPMADGLLYYFPNALAAVAEVSRIGNEQHNPGEPMHWARGKSTDHANKIVRHLIDAGNKDSKGVRHSAYMAWRALALLQEELEKYEGARMPPNARQTKPTRAAEERTGWGTWWLIWAAAFLGPLLLIAVAIFFPVTFWVVIILASMISLFLCAIDLADTHS